MNHEKSAKLFEKAKQLIPGGVNSPVRAFRSVKMDPLFMERGEGQYIYDADGNQYIDYVGSWGPLILGHAHPEIIEAILQAAGRGTSFGASHAAEVELAGMICDAFPGMEQVRLVNSGTEAAMSAIRLARAYTGRDKIIKFAGCYHGHADSFLIQAGSGLMTGGNPSSPGVTRGCAQDTIICQYNDFESIADAFAKNQGQIAAVIVEPFVGNMGLVLPDKEFLPYLRKITAENESLLIFDEVITGFRVTYGGVQTLLDVRPDLTCLGKIIGGGLPVGAYGGSAKIMNMMAPEGPVYQAGTLAGNPLAVAAGLATLKELKGSDWYEGMEVLNYVLTNRIRSFTDTELYDVTIKNIASMWCVFFTGEDVMDYGSAMTADTGKYARYFQGMLERGIYLPPAQFEVCFLSAKHTVEDIEKTAAAACEVIQTICEED